MTVLFVTQINLSEKEFRLPSQPLRVSPLFLCVLCVKRLPSARWKSFNTEHTEKNGRKAETPELIMSNSKIDDMRCGLFCGGVHGTSGSVTIARIEVYG
jgi:hypothetical protein